MASFKTITYDSYKEIKKHLIVYKAFLRNSLVKEMTYRFHFFMMLGVECAFLVWKLLYTFVITNTNVSLNGIPSDAMYLFSGSFLLMTGFYLALFLFNFMNMQNLIGDGTLDFYMVKPISLQFMVTLRTIDFGTTFPNVVGGLAILIYGWHKMIIPQMLNFIIIRGWAISELSDSIWDSNQMPMTIYSKAIRFFATYILPLFVISNYASMFALGQLSLANKIWGLLVPIILFLLARILWKIMLRKYISASS